MAEMMKLTRNIYKMVLALAVTLLLGACAKLAVETEPAISMSVNMPGQTKAVINDKADFERQGTFGVFGYKVQDKTLVDDKTAYHVFSNQKVYNTKKDTNPLEIADWDYTPTKYWDQKTGMHYSFIAYAPYCSSETADPNVSASMVFSSSDGSTNYYALKIDNVPSWQDASSDGCKDFMISNPEWGFGTDFVGKQNKPCYVEFTFKHILALIDLKAYVADGMEYKVSKISVGKESTDGLGVPTAVSTNSYSQGILRQTADESVWVEPTTTIGERGVAVWHESDADDHSDDITLNPAQDLEANPKLISKQLAFPFSVVDKLNISVTFQRQGAVEYDTVDKDINLSNIESGKHYTIILRFEGGDVVDVNVSEVQDWNTIDRDHPVYNW